VTGPVFRAAPAPVRPAFWALTIVVAIGLVNLLLTVLGGGAPGGIGIVFFLLLLVAVFGVRLVAEGRPGGRVLATILGAVLVVYRLAFAVLVVAMSAALPGWALAVTLAQLLVEVVLIVAALVLLHRPEVSAHLAAGREG
jgi:hypothetical protein